MAHDYSGLRVGWGRERFGRCPEVGEQEAVGEFRDRP